MMSPDEICDKYAGMGTGLKVWVEEDTVFIEGDTLALEFLGQLLLSQTTFEGDTGFQLSPSGAGKKLFAMRSTHGIYIHRLQQPVKNEE